MSEYSVPMVGGGSKKINGKLEIRNNSFANTTSLFIVTSKSEYKNINEIYLKSFIFYNPSFDASKGAFKMVGIKNGVSTILKTFDFAGAGIIWTIKINEKYNTKQYDSIKLELIMSSRIPYDDWYSVLYTI